MNVYASRDLVSYGEPYSATITESVTQTKDAVTGKVLSETVNSKSGSSDITVKSIGGIWYQSLDAFNTGRALTLNTAITSDKKYVLHGAIREPVAPLLTTYNNGWVDYTGAVQDVSSTYALASGVGPTYAPNSQKYILLRGTNYPGYTGASVASTMKNSWSSYHTTFVVDYDSVYQVGHRNKIGYGFGQTANFLCPVQIAVCEYPSDQWKQIRAYYNAIVLAKKWATYYNIPWKFNNSTTGGIATGDFTYSLYSEVKASFSNVLSNAGLTTSDMKLDVEYTPANTKPKLLGTYDGHNFYANSTLYGSKNYTPSSFQISSDGYAYITETRHEQETGYDGVDITYTDSANNSVWANESLLGSRRDFANSIENSESAYTYYTTFLFTDYTGTLTVNANNYSSSDTFLYNTKSMTDSATNADVSSMLFSKQTPSISAQDVEDTSGSHVVTTKPSGSNRTIATWYYGERWISTDNGTSWTKAI